MEQVNSYFSRKRAHLLEELKDFIRILSVFPVSVPALTFERRVDNS